MRFAPYSRAPKKGITPAMRRQMILQEESPVQTQLEIGQPNDAYEQEANAVASSVVNGSKAPSISAVGTSVQTSSDSANHASPQLQQQLSATKGQGESLPENVQHEMGSKIGADFSGVKVHTNSNAIQMNKELGAKAFTHGNDIYFNQGNYNTSTNEGKGLLAHELTHTVQQGGGIHPMIQKEDEEEERIIDYMEAFEDDHKGQLEELKEDDAFKDTLLPLILKDEWGVEIDAVRHAFVNYEQFYYEEVGRRAKEAEELEISDKASDMRTKLLGLISKAKVRVEDKLKIANSDEKAHLNLQLELCAEYATHAAQDHVWQYNDYHHGEGLIEGNAFELFAGMPLTEDEFSIERINRTFEDVANSTDMYGYALLKTPMAIRASFWRKVLFESIDATEEVELIDERKRDAEKQLETQEMTQATREELDTMLAEELKLFMEHVRQENIKKGSAGDVNKQLKQFKKLTELQKKMLKANMAKQQLDENADLDKIAFTMADLKKMNEDTLEAFAKANSTMELVDFILNKLAGDTGPPGPSPFEVIRKLMRPLMVEMVMFKGMLTGAEQRMPSLKGISGELDTTIKAFFEAVGNSMQKDILIDVAIGIIPYIGPPISIGRKIKKIVELIETIQSIISIAKTLSDFSTKVGEMKFRIDEVMDRLKYIQEMGMDEKSEQMVLSMIEDYDLLKYIEIPDSGTTDEREKQAEMYRIIYEIPLGLKAFETMYATYSNIDRQRFTNNELAMLGVDAYTTGLLLAPFVAFLANKTMEKLADKITELNDQDLIDRLNPISSKKRRKRKDRKKKTKEKVKSVNKYEFEKKPKVFSKVKKYVEEEEAGVADGGDVWMSKEHFKKGYQGIVKEANKEAGKKKWQIKARKKKTKNKFKPIDLPLIRIQWSNKGDKIGARVMINPEIFRDVNEVLDYHHFGKINGKAKKKGIAWEKQPESKLAPATKQAIKHRNELLQKTLFTDKNYHVTRNLAGGSGKKAYMRLKGSATTATPNWPTGGSGPHFLHLVGDHKRSRMIVAGLMPNHKEFIINHFIDEHVINTSEDLPEGYYLDGKEVKKKAGFETADDLSIDNNNKLQWGTGGATDPESVVKWDGQTNNQGRRVDAVKLTRKAPPGITGQPAEKAPTHAEWDILKTRVNKGKESVYVRAHLLNDSFHGPADYDNLTFASRKANSSHWNEVESKVRLKFRTGEYLYYSVKVHYSHRKQAKIDQVIDDADTELKAGTANAKRVKELNRIIEVARIEKKLPRSMVCHAYSFSAAAYPFNSLSRDDLLKKGVNSFSKKPGATKVISDATTIDTLENVPYELKDYKVIV